MPNNYINVALLGGAGVGKTSICRQFQDGKFTQYYSPTIRNSYPCSLTDTTTKKEYDLKIIDSCGHRRGSITQTSSLLIPDELLINVNAYIIVFSLTDLGSYSHAKDLLNQLADIKDYDLDTTPVLLIGNKSDIGFGPIKNTKSDLSLMFTDESFRPEIHGSLPRCVTNEEVTNYLSENNFDNVRYLENSCKEFTSTAQIFEHLVRRWDFIRKQLAREWKKRKCCSDSLGSWKSDDSI